MFQLLFIFKSINHKYVSLQNIYLLTDLNNTKQELEII
jgi:hypothetical protein